MKNNKWITGLVLVLIGLAFLLNNLGYVDIHWYNIIRLWPVFLVIAGVNLILSGQHATWAKILNAIVILAGFGIILFANTGKHHLWPPNNLQLQFDDDDDDDNNDDHHGVVKIQGNSNFKEPFTADTRIAQLNIAGGGTSYFLKDTTDQLFNAATKEFWGKYEFNNKKTDSVAVLNFKMREKDGKNGRKRFNWDGDQENSATIKLNPTPEWDINVHTGATKLDFDLTKFKIRSLKLKGGAASFDVKLGQSLPVTRLDVTTGASEVHIKIPQNAACSITMQSGLSSNDFEGFNKINDNHYETAGFAAATNKIYIKMAGAVSDFNVSRY
ncbi:MAG: hypothetical protein EOP47_22260 [Sphingobacteriaceae bacterium]|nr:MAG: hypothetical protein EOP47_22260 [Sphingobacteriaceae bacterium]